MVSDEKTFDININDNFVETEYIKNILKRSFMYLDSGYAIHLRGAAGVGKTSLAVYIASKIGRPMIFISGSEEINDFNLVGGYFGEKKSLVVDNYISSVYKREEEIKKTWMDGRILTACKNGYTIIYDEFTRAKPEINNVLLSILEEQMIDVPMNTSGNTYVKINPNFRIIFTSNFEEYVGVYKSANALVDRMITIDINGMDEDTEKKIIMSKSGINPKDAEKIVSFTKYIRSLMKDANWVSLRSSIMLATVIKSSNMKIASNNLLFRQICKDIYNSSSLISNRELTDKKKFEDLISKAIDSVFGTI